MWNHINNHKIIKWKRTHNLLCFSCLWTTSLAGRFSGISSTVHQSINQSEKSIKTYDASGFACKWQSSSSLSSCDLTLLIDVVCLVRASCSASDLLAINASILVCIFFSIFLFGSVSIRIQLWIAKSDLKVQSQLKRSAKIELSYKNTSTCINFS